MGNFYSKYDISLSNFRRGIVSRLDRRESPVDSLKDCVGFNLSEVIGQTKKDYGSSAYVSLPAGVLDVVCFDVLRIESLSADFMLVVGTDSAGQLHWYVRKYYDLEARGGLVDEWIELTENESGTITTKTSDVAFRSSALVSTTNDYYIGWVVINTTRDEWAYISDYVGSTKEYTIDESRSSWVTTDVVKFYRFPDVYALSLTSGTAVSDPRQSWFRTNTVGDRMAVGYQRNAGTSEVPMHLSLVQRQWFNGGQNFLSPKYNKLYFARETPNHTTLEAHGLSATVEKSTANLLTPSVDLEVQNNGTEGWKKTSGGFTNLYQDVDEGLIQDGNTIEANLTTAYPSAGYTVGMGSHSIPVNGTITFRVRATCSPNDKGSLALQIVEYDASGSPRVARGNPIIYAQVGEGWRDFTISRTIEELGITGTVYLGLSVGAAIAPFGPLSASSVKIKVDTIDGKIVTETAAKKIRLIFVPQYDGYMLGRPVLQEFSIESASNATYIPRIGVEFAQMDKRLTDLLIFTDDGDATRTAGEFRSAWEVKMASVEPNRATTPFNIVSVWSFLSTPVAGTGTLAIDTTTAVVGTGTKFLTELSVGDMIITGAQSRRVVAIASDTALTVHSGFAGVLTGQTFVYYDPQRRYKTQSSTAVAGIVASAGDDRPRMIPLNRSTDGLLTLSEYLGYGISKDIPSIAVNWRHQVQTAFGQSALVVVDESDTVLRRTHYSDLVHNDRSFPQVKSDVDGNAVMLFLAAKGEILGMFGQLGNLYIYKPTSVTIIDGSTTESHVFVADVISKHGIVQTPIGIIHCGLHGIYVYPHDGGLEQDIATPIREDYAAISKTRKQNIVVGSCPELGVMLVTIPKTDTPSQFDPTAFETWIYHYETGAWWKRQFERVPLRYTKLYDNTLVFATIRNGEQTVGSGTISTVGAAVVGSISPTTKFTTEGRVGYLIKVAGQYRRVTVITDANNLTMESAFTGDDIPPGTAYSFVYPRVMKYPDKTVYTDDGEGVYWRLETQWLACDTLLQKTLNAVILSAQDATSASVPLMLKVYFDRSDTPFSTVKSATLGNASRFSEIVMAIAKPNSFREVKLVIERDSDYTQLQATGKFDVSELRLTGETHSTGKDE